MSQVSDIASNNEANVGLVNVGGVNPTFNIELKRSDNRKPSMFERVSHALDPVGYARKQGEAALTALDYEIEMTRRVMSEFPFMSPERARLYAHGHNCTEAQARNFEAVVEKVEDLMDEPPKELPEPAVEDALTDAMCDAYDEDARDLLARVVKGEFDVKGSVSRNALSIIKRMDSDDVRAFADFCALCSGGRDVETGIELNATPCIVAKLVDYGSTYKEIPYGDVMQLNALGLVRMSATVSFENDEASLCIGGRGYHTERIGEGSKPLTIGAVALTRSGDELAAFFEKGTHPMLLELLQEELSKQGFELKPHLSPTLVEKLASGESEDA